MLSIIKRIVDPNEKNLHRYRGILQSIQSLEDEARALSDEDFPIQTDQLRQQIASEEKSLDDILPWAYALVREAARRTVGMRHFDVQLIAGIAMHEGKVVEQKTGEGKTLTATTALYLNALTGKGVHLVTVNDYLARRDAGWMGVIYDFLGVSTGVIISGTSYRFDAEYHDETGNDWRLSHLKPVPKKEAYGADITYGINSEFGFDYLRDNMSQNPDRLVQRNFYFVIVDEADSVLIDEARTPHIISAPYEQDVSRYYQYAAIIKRLDHSTDVVIDEKLKTAHLSEEGIQKVEQMLGLENIYEQDFETLFHIEAALKAESLFQKDNDYIVRDGEVIIVDEFTGRLLEGRRFSEGLHQAIEAKEGVSIKQESRTLATVSLQNYFRMYDKLAGMTGTAATEAEEFLKIYESEVVVVPTNRTMQRADEADEVYKTIEGKYNAIADEVAKEHKNGRPILIGTTSIDKNEYLSSLLRKRGVPHELLNAKNHEREAQIIAKAGEKGAVTVATNMAGRGVDIVLGGMQPVESELAKEEFTNADREWREKHDEVIALGGLYVIGTERHESRRIDNQLRGRSGRQGDPGRSKFYVSLEDDLMRIFGGEQITKLMNFFNLPEDQPLSHGMVSKSIESAQTKVEGFNFDMRKRLVEYDDVLNRQREILYRIRRTFLVQADEDQQAFESEVAEQFRETFTQMTTNYYSLRQLQKNQYPVDDEEEADADGSEPESERQNQSRTSVDQIVRDFGVLFPGDPPQLKELLEEDDQNRVIEYLMEYAQQRYQHRKTEVGDETWTKVVRSLLLSTLDKQWNKHLTAIDDLREGINLRGYAQLNPLVEYKNEAFRMFEELISGIAFEFTRRVMHVRLQKEDAQQSPTQSSGLDEANVQYHAASGVSASGNQQRKNTSVSYGSSSRPATISPTRRGTASTQKSASVQPGQRKKKLKRKKRNRK